ncbi:MAG: hypothetical protein INR73_27200 [Williamsia sp.]|nr:hypothetical protein [Williamsia sp.]
MIVPPDTQQTQEKVPLFPSWNYWYALVTGWLLLLIALFFFITNRFA